MELRETARKSRLYGTKDDQKVSSLCAAYVPLCVHERVREPGSMMYFTCSGSVSYFALQECLTRQVMGQRLTVIGTDGQVGKYIF